jgi:broad specificity phosphatase PhoE
MFSDINNVQIIVLLRHAKAIKNEQKRHGGKGSELVESAKREIQEVSSQLLLLSSKFDKILYSPRTQCEQTAKYLSELLNVNAVELQELEPISLGIVDGLSDEEVANEYPEVSDQLTRWRNGEIEINQLKIPQMTDCQEFYNKGKAFIDNIVNSKKSVIILATRSIMVLLMSVLLGRNSQIGGNYREIKWGNAEFAVFTYSNIGKSLHIDISTLTI